MALTKIVLELTILTLVNSFVTNNDNGVANEEIKSDQTVVVKESDKNLTDVFNGVYIECFLHLSYSCIQRKTLLYLKELNKLSEVSVIGDYIKFGKV